MDDLIPVHEGNCLQAWDELRAQAVATGMRLPAWVLARDEQDGDPFTGHRRHHAKIHWLRRLIRKELETREQEKKLGITWRF